MFALVDCNNFYVSCERVFNPKLKGPVAVLSNNDGCIVARSQEVKDLGVPMGAPYFQNKELLERHRVTIFSSNYTLYGDMSNRVMDTLKTFTPDIEIYSVDEAFLYFPSVKSAEELHAIRNRVKRWTGIPVSIGMGRSKTLAKLANHKAKKEKSGVVILHSEEETTQALNHFPIEDVWGIGRQYSRFLRSKGIRTAGDLIKVEDAWAKKHLTVVGLRLIWELRGVSCLPIDELPAAKKAVISSKSFGHPIDHFDDLSEATATYVARAAEKIRSQGSCASYLSVFVVEHKRSDNYYPSTQAGASLAEPTAYTPLLITEAKQLLKALFREGVSYRKTGVMLSGLVPKGSAQLDLFEAENIHKGKQEKAMKVLDSLNAEYGKKILRSAAEGKPVPHWGMKRNLRSPAYTTKWSDILKVKA